MIKNLDLIIEHEVEALAKAGVTTYFRLELLQSVFYRPPSMLTITYLDIQYEKINSRTERYSPRQISTRVLMYDCINDKLKSIEFYDGDFRESGYSYLRNRKSILTPGDSGFGKKFQHAKKMTTIVRDKLRDDMRYAKELSDQDKINVFLKILERLVK